MKMFWISLISGAYGLTCYAQITLTSADVMNLIGTSQTFIHNISESPIPVDVGPAGENQIWNFTDLTFSSEEYTLEYIEPQGTPFFDEFPTANLAGKMTFMIDTVEISSYTYLEVTENRLTFLGSGTDFLGTTTIETDNDFAPLPITYETEWMITSFDTLVSDPSFTIVAVETVLARIDGWGMASVPAGTFESLRLHTDWTEYIHTIVDNVIVLTTTTVGSDFSWLSKTSIEMADFNFEAPNYTEADDLTLLMDIGASYIAEQPTITNHFSLKQNYPNPFNPKTTINYELPMTSDVELSIYNLRGQKVVTLVSAYQPAGFYEFEWNAEGMASGVYLYKLQAGNFSDMKKMILLR